MAETEAAMNAGTGYTMGHIALHYPEKDDGPVAARLLEIIGLRQTQVLPLADGSNFYRFVVDDRHHDRGDGIIYLSQVPPAQKALHAAIREALAVNTDAEHAAVRDMREAMKADPEYSFHVGLLTHSLEELEGLVSTLRDLAANDPALKGRLNIVINRPLPGDAEVDARLDASPVFGGVTRHAYGRNGVQVFIETDLLVSGPLGDNMVLEIDYVFPNAASHILSVVDLG